MAATIEKLTTKQTLIANKSIDQGNPKVNLLQIEPTTKCNFSCGFCCGRKMDQSDITMETYMKALELFPDLERVELHGEGEPMSHSEIFDMVQAARERGMQVSSITNGSMFTPERIEKILDSGIGTLFVSIESPRVDEFKQIRGGDLVKVKAGIRAFLESLRKGIERRKIP